MTFGPTEKRTENQKMRIFRGLENIHSVIDRHEAEWRKDQGEEPNYHDAVSIEEAVRRRLTAQPEGSGRFDADRFLGGKNESVNKKKKDTQPEAVEIIPSKEGRHSWLYNEVMKAINDAAKGNKNTKIIAVFVPVVQNGKEFEDLPADEKITVSSINEDDVKIEPLIETESESEAVEALPETETSAEDFELLPEAVTEEIQTDTELAEAFREMEEKLDEEIQEEHQQEAETESNDEPEESAEPQPEVVETEAEQTESESPEASIAMSEVFEPEPEIKETAPEAVETEAEQTESELPEVFETEPEITEQFTETDEQSEPITFDEISEEAKEIALPEPLDDDEVVDESQKPVENEDNEDGEAIIIDGTDDEIEIIPDTKI